MGWQTKKRKSKHANSLKKAKKYYNQFIRISKSNEDGYCKCVTCGKIMFWEGGDCQASHFYHGLDFVVNNMHPACTHCNKYLHGNLIEYTQFMLKEYGQEIIDKLKLKKGKVNKYSQDELEIMAEAYREAVKKEKEKRGL